MRIHCSRCRALVLTSCLVPACVTEDPIPPGAATLGTLSAGTTEGAESGTSDPSSSSAASSSASSSSAEGTTTSPADDTTTDPPATGTGDTAPPPSLCDDVAGEMLVPPSTCDGPSGNTTTEIPANGLYSTSWFGCYLEDDGSIYQDPFDNCEFACGSQGLCPDGQDGPTCEANLRWFAADADRYGCGGRIRVTNCENGNAVVLVTLDRGPNCNTVEMACDTPVLDMSHDAMDHLFDGSFYGGCEHETVVVEAVDPGTPLGPV
jgi:hypothetical protein